MHPSTDYGGFPVGAKTRLVMSVVMGVFFGFLLFEASVNLRWFNAIRGLYLALGIANGIVLGFIETRTVIGELSTKAKARVWRPFVICNLTLVLAFLVAIGIFGVPEYLPFGAYAVLSTLPTYYATSGWYYYLAEKRDKVSIVASVWRFTYWKEPLPDYSNMFANFVSDLATRDYWWVSSPRGYVGYTRQLISALEAKSCADPETKEALMGILRVMDKYRRRGLQSFSAIMISMTLLGVWILVLAGTNTFGLSQVLNHKIVSGREISIALGLVPAVVFFIFFLAVPRLQMKRFEKAILSLLESTDTDKFYSIL